MERRRRRHNLYLHLHNRMHYNILSEKVKYFLSKRSFC